MVHTIDNHRYDDLELHIVLEGLENVVFEPLFWTIQWSFVPLFSGGHWTLVTLRGVVGPPKIGFLRGIHQLNVGQGPRFADNFQWKLGDVSDGKILYPDLQDSLHVRAGSQPSVGFL